MIELKECYGHDSYFDYHISVSGKAQPYDDCNHEEALQERHGDWYSLFHDNRWWDFEDNMKEYSALPENEGIIFKVNVVTRSKNDYFFTYYFYNGTMQKHQLVVPEFADDKLTNEPRKS